MKKILILLLTLSMLGVVGCSSTEQEQPEQPKQEEKQELTLTDEDIKLVEDNLKTFTDGTAYDGASFKIELDKKDLKVSVIKDINDIMTSYKTTTSDDTVATIKKSLTFDDAYDVIKEESGKKFDCMQVFIFNDEEAVKNNDYYTLKSIF